MVLISEFLEPIFILSYLTHKHISDLMLSNASDCGRSQIMSRDKNVDLFGTPEWYWGHPDAFESTKTEMCLWVKYLRMNMDPRNSDFKTIFRTKTSFSDFFRKNTVISIERTTGKRSFIKSVFLLAEYIWTPSLSASLRVFSARY